MLPTSLFLEIKRDGPTRPHTGANLSSSLLLAAVQKQRQLMEPLLASRSPNTQAHSRCSSQQKCGFGLPVSGQGP